MYRLKHANSVPIRPSLFRTGFPVHEHMIPNIAIVSQNNSDPIHLNALVLRQALLNSPKEVEDLLGLKVIDTFAQPVPKQPTEEPKKKVETKSKQASKESKEADEWV